MNFRVFKYMIYYHSGIRKSKNVSESIVSVKKIQRNIMSRKNFPL